MGREEVEAATCPLDVAEEQSGRLVRLLDRDLGLARGAGEARVGDLPVGYGYETTDGVLGSR